MNKETLQEYNTRLAENNTSLDDILTTINNLPDASSSSGGKVNEGVVLFEGYTLENITLSDTVNNYEFIEIYFRDNIGYYNYVKLYDPKNNNKASLSLIECTDMDNYYMNFKSKNIIISDNTITNEHGGAFSIRFSTKNINEAYKVNCLYITKVIGYK